MMIVAQNAAVLAGQGAVSEVIGHSCTTNGSHDQRRVSDIDCGEWPPQCSSPTDAGLSDTVEKFRVRYKDHCLVRVELAFS